MVSHEQTEIEIVLSLDIYMFLVWLVSHDACIKQKICATENFPICFRKIVPPAPKIKTKMKNDSYRKLLFS